MEKILNRSDPEDPEDPEPDPEDPGPRGPVPGKSGEMGGRHLIVPLKRGNPRGTPSRGMPSRPCRETCNLT